jgi:hypothetical protein
MPSYYSENLLSKDDVTWGTVSYGPFCLEPYSARVKQDNTKAKLQAIQAGPSVWRFLNGWLSNRNAESLVTHAPTHDYRRSESHHSHTILEQLFFSFLAYLMTFPYLHEFYIPTESYSRVLARISHTVSNDKYYPGVMDQHCHICKYFCTSAEGFLVIFEVLMRVLWRLQFLVDRYQRFVGTRNPGLGPPSPYIRPTFLPSLTYSSTRKKEAAGSFETLATIYHNTRRNVPGYSQRILDTGPTDIYPAWSLFQMQSETRRSCGQHGRHILRQLSSAWWSCVIVESWSNPPLPTMIP